MSSLRTPQVLWWNSLLKHGNWNVAASPFGGFLVAGAWGVFVGGTGRCVFRVGSVRAFGPLGSLGTRRGGAASPAAASCWAGRAAVMPLSINKEKKSFIKATGRAQKPTPDGNQPSHLSFLVGVSSFSFSFFSSFNRASAFSFSFFSFSFSRSSFSFSFS